MNNRNQNKMGGGILQVLYKKLVRACYIPLFTIRFRENIWKLYNSYHETPKEWKKILWNKYMELHSASISIDARLGGPLVLPHGVSGIFITQSAVIGKNVVIFQQVTIGANTVKGSKSYGAPVIGDNVYIGAGAKIIGNAEIADNCRIGANCVVVDNVPFNSLVITDKPRIIQRNQLQDNTFNPFLK
jgi:serine O-acetyltransferase